MAPIDDDVEEVVLPEESKQSLEQRLGLSAVGESLELQNFAGILDDDSPSKVRPAVNFRLDEKDVRRLDPESQIITNTSPRERPVRERRESFDSGLSSEQPARPLITSDTAALPGSKPDYNESCAASLCQNRYFENITLAVITLNAVWIGVDMENNGATLWTEAHMVFKIADNFFCTYFTFEVLVRFFAFRKKSLFWKDRSFVFDSLLVVLMIIETWLVVLYVMTLKGGAGGDGLRSLTVLRLLRLLRLGRMIRLMRSMPELLILMKGLMMALRSVGVSLGVLCGMLFVFGIIFTQRYRDLVDIGVLHDEYFGRLGISVCTLFVQGTILDEFSSVALALKEDSYPMMIVFYIFMLGSSLTILNMLIGVLSEVVSKCAVEENAVLSQDGAKLALQNMFAVTDVNSDAAISGPEFFTLLDSDNPTITKACKDLGIDRDRLWDLYKYLYTDEEADLEHSQRQSGDHAVPPAESDEVTEVEVVGAMITQELQAVRCGAVREAWTGSDKPATNGDMLDSKNSGGHVGTGQRELKFSEFFDELIILKDGKTISVTHMSILRRACGKRFNAVEERLASMGDPLREVMCQAEERSRNRVLAGGGNRKLAPVPTSMLLSQLEQRLQGQ